MTTPEQIVENLKDAATALDNWGEDVTGSEVREGVALIKQLQQENERLKAEVDRLNMWCAHLGVKFE